MTERYSIAIAMIVLLLAIALFAMWRMRRTSVRQRRGTRIDIGSTGDR